MHADADSCHAITVNAHLAHGDYLGECGSEPHDGAGDDNDEGRDQGHGVGNDNDGSD